MNIITLQFKEAGNDYSVVPFKCIEDLEDFAYDFLLQSYENHHGDWEYTRSLETLIEVCFDLDIAFIQINYHSL